MHNMPHWIDAAEKYFFGLYERVPGGLHPYIPAALIVLGVLLYAWMLILMGRWAVSKGQRFWLGVWLGLINGPVLGGIFIALINDAPHTKHVRRAKRAR